MGLPSEPIVKKFFSNKIESTRGDWYSYLIRIARIFYSFDGQEYDREKLLDQFTKMSGRQSDAQRDVSNFRDEFGAYGTYLGIYHLEQIGGAWKIIVSNAAKQFLCVENPNAAAFCRAQLALFQYPNGAGAALTSGGSINVQANSRSDTVREISNGIRLNPFRLICRIVVSQVEIAKRALNEITIPYETLFCMVNDDRINRAYSPPLEVVNSVFSEYSTAASQVTMILDGITNFKRNFHILEKTGLFTRDSRFGLMVAQANYTAAYECIKAVSGITASFDALGIPQHWQRKRNTKQRPRRKRHGQAGSQCYSKTKEQVVSQIFSIRAMTRQRSITDTHLRAGRTKELRAKTLLDMGGLLPQEEWVTTANISQKQRRFGCHTYFS